MSSRKDIHQMNVKELVQLCKQRGIRGYSNLRKKELKRKCNRFRIPIFVDDGTILPEEFNDFFDFVSNPDVIKSMMLFLSRRYGNDCVVIGEGETEGFLYNVRNFEDEEDELEEDEEEGPRMSIIQRMLKRMEDGDGDIEEDIEDEDNEGIDLANWGGEVTELITPPDVENQIYNCQDENKRFIIVTLLLNNEIENFAHANLIIFDTLHNTMERFEPYGKIPNGNFNEEDIDEKLTRLVATPMEYEYIKPLDFCPIRGFQTIQEQQQNATINLCQAWTIWYTDMRLRYPDINRTALIAKMLTVQNKKGGLNTFIINFIRFFIHVYNAMEDEGEFHRLLGLYTTF